MSSIGPQLPPHLTKRKRSTEDESPDSPSTKTSKPNNENEIALDGEDSDSDDGYGPSAPKPAATAGPQRPSIGPSLPPTAASGGNTDEIVLNSDSDDDDTGPAPPPSKAAAPKPTTQPPRRVMGPAPPPADLASRPTTAPDSGSDSGSDSDDDYGPALPGAAPSKNTAAGPSLPRPAAAAAPEKPARDDWMLAPPEPTGYQERDPTKIKARKFASGAGATSRPSGGAGGGISKIWTETPEEKAKRLADAVLGRGADNEQAASASASKGGSGRSGGGGGGSSGHGGAKDDGHQDKIRAFTEQTRGKSLYEQHQTAKKAGGGSSGSKKADEEEDDDPSKRAFDREKDMGLGMKITASQRKELLNRASDFGGRFQKGNYL